MYSIVIFKLTRSSPHLKYFLSHFYLQEPMAVLHQKPEYKIKLSLPSTKRTLSKTPSAIVLFSTRNINQMLVIVFHCYKKHFIGIYIVFDLMISFHILFYNTLFYVIVQFINVFAVNFTISSFRT